VDVDVSVGRLIQLTSIRSLCLSIGATRVASDAPTDHRAHVTAHQQTRSGSHNSAVAVQPLLGVQSARRLCQFNTTADLAE